MTQPFQVGDHIISAIPPRLPPAAMKTYSIIAPKSTHFRPATCAEVDCPAHLHGWTSTIDERTDLGQFQADYIRRTSGRGFTECKDDTGQAVFTFHPGQTCFAAGDHNIRLERPELYVVRGGDFRGNPRGDVARLPGSAAWTDDFGEHQEVLADKMKEG